MNNSSLPAMASISDLQRDYAALVKQVKKTGQPLLVLKKNKLEAVLLSPDTYKRIIESLENYEGKMALEAVSLYEEEKKKGKLKRLKNIDALFE